MNSKQTLKTATIVAMTGAFILMAALVNSSAHAKISPTCDNKPGSCPGKSSDPGQGHEDTGNQNPAGHLPPGQN